MFIYPKTRDTREGKTIVLNPVGVFFSFVHKWGREPYPRPRPTCSPSLDIYL